MSTTIPTIPSPPEGYAARPATLNDAAVVAALIAGCQRADGDEPDMSVEELIEDWQQVNLAEESIVVTNAAGDVAAFADLANKRFVQVSVYGYVHPEHRGRGLGAFLAAWGEAWTRARMPQAPPEAQVVVQHYVRATDNAARQLFETGPYVAVRTYFWMAIELEEAPPEPVWPAGIVVRTFRAGQDEQRVYTTGETTFRDLWGRPASTYDRWIAPTRADDFDPSLWFLAEDEPSGATAGVCLCRVTAGRGYVGQLGVLRPWRRRGLGLALLRHAFGEFFRRGIQEVTLSVDGDSTTGAPQLYMHAGMHVRRSYVLYRNVLREGRDMSATIEDEL